MVHKSSMPVLVTKRDMNLLTKQWARTRNLERLTWATSSGLWLTMNIQASKVKSTTPNSKCSAFWEEREQQLSTKSSCFRDAPSARWLSQLCLLTCPRASITKRVKSLRHLSTSVPLKARLLKLLLRKREVTKLLPTRSKWQLKRTKHWLTKSEAFQRQSTLTCRRTRYQEWLSFTANVFAQWRTNCI